MFSLFDRIFVRTSIQYFWKTWVIMIGNRALSFVIKKHVVLFPELRLQKWFPIFRCWSTEVAIRMFFVQIISRFSDVNSKRHYLAQRWEFLFLLAECKEHSLIWSRIFFRTFCQNSALFSFLLSTVKKIKHYYFCVLQLQILLHILSAANVEGWQASYL